MTDREPLPQGHPDRCDVRCPGKPFVCQRHKGHDGLVPHADWSVNVGGEPWTWEDSGGADENRA